MDTKNENKDTSELNLITAYEITPKSIKSEIKMFYDKFGNKEVKRLANIIMKEKREKK